MTAPLVSFDLLATDKILEDYDIYPGRELKVLGFPFGLESNAFGYPILRIGCIASFPLLPTSELRTFLMDFRVFEGNSGGPVYLHLPSWQKRGSGDIGRGPELQMLLGLVSKQKFITETQNPKLLEQLSIADIVHASLIKETINMLPSVPVIGSYIIRQVPFNNQKSYLDQSIRRLKEKVPEDTIAQFKTKAADWESTPTDGNWTETSEAVTFTATKYSITSKLTVESQPRSGATIKYQTVGQKDRNELPTTAKQLTTCVENIPIGRYYIWTERGGKQTSDFSHVYEIVQPEEKVEIIEYDSKGKSK